MRSKVEKVMTCVMILYFLNEYGKSYFLKVSKPFRSLRDISQNFKGLTESRYGMNLSFPSAVIEMKTLTEALALKEFDLSDTLSHTSQFYFRILYGLSPSHYQKDAKFRFQMAVDPIPANCILERKLQEVTLVSCDP